MSRSRNYCKYKVENILKINTVYENLKYLAHGNSVPRSCIVYKRLLFIKLSQLQYTFIVASMI